MSMCRFGLLACLAIFVLVLSAVTLTVADEHESCEDWAQSGECTTNPGYMEKSCPEACAKFGNVAASEKPAEVPGSLYEITETDLGGNSFQMEKMKGKVLYIVNVASYCGYTAENYATFKKLKQYRSEGFEIILAPCNQCTLPSPLSTIPYVPSSLACKYQNVPSKQQSQVRNPNLSSKFYS